MRTPILITVVLFGLTLPGIGDEGFVAQDFAQEVALARATSLWSEARLGVKLPYYGFDGQITAYAFVFSLKDQKIPSAQELRALSELSRRLGQEAARQGDLERWRNFQDLRWGVGRYATVVVGARYDQVPILEYADCLPRYYTAMGEARLKASAELGAGAEFSRVYYLTPQEEWFEFVNDEERILIHAYSLKVHRLEELLPKLQGNSGSLPVRVDPRWSRLKSLKALTTIEQGYVDSVPFCLWSYGCSPTASAKIGRAHV